MWLDQWGNWRTDAGVGAIGYSIRMARLLPYDGTFTAYYDPASERRGGSAYLGVGGFVGDECAGPDSYHGTGFVDPIRGIGLQPAG